MTMNLTTYLSDAISRLFRTALRPSDMPLRERVFLLRSAAVQKKAAKKRLISERKGAPVPPFLIASIATQCNLHCEGCYARANHACADKPSADELSGKRWGELFKEAENLGVSFILLAGGEPLERSDVLDAAAKTRGVIFPVFTNGTLLSGAMTERFDRRRNLVPVLSLEGGRRQTDARRGAGVFDLILKTMRELNSRKIFYGVSVTVTRENLGIVSDEDFIAELRLRGCRFVIFVEYVPVDGNTAPAPGEAQRGILAERKDTLRAQFPDMIFLAFPGDEKHLGGCLAAGRGFFHINAFGAAEPCPFSPYSDTSLRSGGIAQALGSPLFREIRESGLEALEHVGGCALFESREKIENMLNVVKRPV